jgi:hypothetical protein
LLVSLGMTATATAPLPWWLSEGTETCPLCLQLYHFELEVRCPDCDRPRCPSCAQRLDVTVVGISCDGCADEGEEA